MHRGLTGRYLPSVAGGVSCRAFVPAPLPPEPALAMDDKLQDRLAKAHLALGRLDGISTLLPDAQLFLYSYVRKEAVMSSQIEGTQSSLSDLMIYEMEGVPGVPMDDVQEVSCYVRALNLGVQRIREGHPITIRLVLELHEALMTHGRGTHRRPGAFRQNQVWIGGHRADEAALVPPPANQIADCCCDFERFLNDEPATTAPVIKAALAHVQFETIHPFMDGNGRLGRLLIPLILVQAGILSEPLLYLSVFFKRHRQVYYEHLQNVRLTGDWESWLLFFVDAIADTANHAVVTAQSLNALLIEDKRRLSELGRLAGSANQVLEALFHHPIANIAALHRETGLAQATIGKVLELLENQLGIVQELTGNRRNRVFAYSAYVALLNSGQLSWRERQ
ncbi:Fic family protein [Salinicola halophilus]|uniref:Fic family protein n=1 Tax=Salinicola halophilus TaxID=184065 RepID=UPI000DA1A04F|nr:Fic family protein [Salinicola halophilus]